MKKILILGGAGQMGSVVALKLLNQYDVTVGDIWDVPHRFYTDWDIHGLPYGKHTEYKHIDVSKTKIKELQKEFKKYDLIVSCVPSQHGFYVVHAAAGVGVNCVDLSFNKDDPFYFDDIAKENNCTIIPDAGLAPGLTNLFVGRELAEHGKLHQVKIYVGGVSQSPFVPYGYEATWSVEDLLEMYLRPRRNIFQNKVCTLGVPAIRYYHDHSVVVGNSHVIMNCIPVDGLRTLLRFEDKIRFMEECALRWPGHCLSVQKLIEEGKFVEEISKCTEGLDTVVFKIIFNLKSVDSFIKSITMVTQGTENISAMAKTTAGTCAIVADMVLQGVYNEPGVHPLEDVGENRIAFQFILDKLAEDGVNFKVS